MSSDLYSVISGLQVSQQDVLEAELLTQQILQAQYPDLDLRQGTGLADLTIRPSALALATVRTALNYYFSQNTLSGVTDSSATDIVDALLSNWFLERNTGTLAVINVRLYFARQVSVTLTPDVFFSPDNVLLYYPSTTYSFPASSLTFDSFSNEYYVDVNLTAGATGTQYSLGSGSLLYFSSFNSYFLHGEINYLVQESTNSETNTQFLARAKSAISTRNLINIPSIESNLSSTFNYLSQIYPVGMGDPQMIRDQLYANITVPQPTTPTNITYNAETVTVTLPNHGFQTGQSILVKGGKPSLLNGGYSIAFVDVNTFTYQMDDTPSVQVTTFPTITAIYDPLLIHNGGMVDVYCGNTIASQIIQVTTDSNGNAILSGPVYSFKRSSVTGGSSDDTIPFQNSLVYSSYTLDQTNKIFHVAQTAHGLSTGAMVAVSGIAQSLSVTAISCIGFTVTATCPSHGLSTGTSITISGVTPLTYNGTYSIVVVNSNTFSFTVSANIPTAGAGLAMIASNPNITNEYPITVLGANAYDIPVPTLWVNATTSGTLVLEVDVPYTYSNVYSTTANVTSITQASGVATVVFPNHGLSVGEYVSIAGVTQSQYNGSKVVQSVIDQNTFTYNISGNPASPATTTAGITGTSVIPWEDYGFSTRQEIRISFGSQYANSTASFLTGYFQNLDSIQSYLENASNRVVCADLLARGFNFYLLDLSLTAYNTATPDASLVTATTAAYLASLSPGSVFVMADLINKLTEAGITGIQTPIGVAYSNYTRFLVPPTTGTIVDYLDPNDATSIFILNNVTTNSIAV